MEAVASSVPAGTGRERKLPASTLLTVRIVHDQD
jgi:hypothetical protein